MESVPRGKDDNWCTTNPSTVTCIVCRTIRCRRLCARGERLSFRRHLNETWLELLLGGLCWKGRMEGRVKGSCLG